MAGLSDQLELEAIVINTAWTHPALVIRQFAQLAQMIVGDRVTAGLGAGWSAEEFDAIGLTMPSFRRRTERLREVLALTRALFDNGLASQDGDQVVARDLPLSPRTAQPPALLVGGGSDGVLEMAGIYADVLDLHGHPSRGKLVGATMQEARHGDALRRSLTTVEDLEDRIQVVRRASSDAGIAPTRDGVGIHLLHCVRVSECCRKAERQFAKTGHRYRISR